LNLRGNTLNQAREKYIVQKNAGIQTRHSMKKYAKVAVRHSQLFILKKIKNTAQYLALNVILANFAEQ
jgi:hypothetical protein